jgi:hypothetical protein
LPEFHHDLEAVVLEVQLSLALSDPTLAITRIRSQGHKDKENNKDKDEDKDKGQRRGRG